MRERDQAIQVDHFTLRVPFASRTFFDSEKPHQKRFHFESTTRRVIYEFLGTRRGANVATTHEKSLKKTTAFRLSIQSNIVVNFGNPINIVWVRMGWSYVRVSTTLVEYPVFIIVPDIFNIGSQFGHNIYFIRANSVQVVEWRMAVLLWIVSMEKGKV